jgi:chromosome segregation ATPase
MTTEQNQSSSNSTTDDKPDVQELQANIEQTRHDLGETVDALTAKMDVKSRTRARLNDTKQRATVKLNDTRGQATVKLQDARAKTSQLTATAKQNATDDAGKPKPAVLAGAGGVVAALVAVVSVAIWKKRR